MKLISINVGQPRVVDWKGKEYTTGIFKYPVDGPIVLRKLNLEGDKQVDLSVHGGPDRPVYVYPAEHYDFWKTALNQPVLLPWGSFGENFTSSGILEDDIHIGDHIRFGSVVLMPTQPRMPCVKLGIRFNDAAMVKRFMETERCGFYMAVVKEGEVTAGDKIEIVSRAENSMSIIELRRIYMAKDEPAAIQRALNLPALSQDWREQFLKRLADCEPATTSTT
ncbi:MAG TPA: MOSC domain-containing protein [Pirellulales bacterium]|nr:MOSC domain-containing protein [Pirellulales bacterium]